MMCAAAYVPDITSQQSEELSRQQLLHFIDKNVIGGEAQFNGPFGLKKVFYCDYTASGRSLQFIERFIARHVNEFYANTHTTTTITSKQTTMYRHDARDIIKDCVNASSEDVIIFTGSGSTSAIHKLQNTLEISGERAKKTVVLVGPFEHHSNILPWKESGATVVRVKEDVSGLVDMTDLENKLKEYAFLDHLILGCFSAASNVTGILTDTLAVAAMLHKYGAFSFWDYATAAPYLDIDMNPSTNRSDWNCSKDAVFISTHKFVGGPGSPGILIAKKKLFVNRVPHGHGGGTVQYVSRDKHHYLNDIEAREEGGTPAIVESIRAGMVFQLKKAVSPVFIAYKEEELARQAFNRWQHNENLLVLGNREVPRLPIFSFVIRHPESGKLLHHNFIAVLLNDLFGIQARGGCACAGPYAHDLLGISEENAEKFFDLIREDRQKHNNQDPVEGVRPGFVRISLPYFASDEFVDYVLTAIDLTATHGWKMLPQYKVNFSSGEWTCRRNFKADGPGYNTLHDIKYDQGFFEFTAEEESLPQLFISTQTCLEDAINELERATNEEPMAEALEDPLPLLGKELEHFVWFLQPREALAHIMAIRWQEHLALNAELELSQNNLIMNDPTCLSGQQFVISQEEGLIQPYVEEVESIYLNSDFKEYRQANVKEVPDHHQMEHISDDTAVVPETYMPFKPFAQDLGLYSEELGTKGTHQKGSSQFSCDSDHCLNSPYFRRNISLESGYDSDEDEVVPVF